MDALVALTPEAIQTAVADGLVAGIAIGMLFVVLTLFYGRLRP